MNWIEFEQDPIYMAFKDDDGYWRVCTETTTEPIKFNTYEELEKSYPSLRES